MAQPSPSTHDPRACDGALAQVFGILGKRWNGIILGTLANGPTGFARLRRSIGGISDSVLSDRLSELATVGLVRRSVIEGPPITVEYALTGAGESLLPSLNQLTVWAREHLPPPPPPC